MGHFIFGDFPHGGSSGGLPEAPFGLLWSPNFLRRSSAHLCQPRTVRYTLHFTHKTRSRPWLREVFSGIELQAKYA
jgi:hypothetical protein